MIVNRPGADSLRSPGRREASLSHPLIRQIATAVIAASNVL
jgi:hypothetical protein